MICITARFMSNHIYWIFCRGWNDIGNSTMEIQKKEWEEQELRDSLPERIEAMEARLEEVMEIAEELREEIEEMKGIA